MPLLHNDPIAALTPEVIAWRQHIHSNPELGFNEHQTARFVADKLRSFGLNEVHEGIGGTGVVGILRGGKGTRAIGLRAELDALPVVEKTRLPYASTNAGVMHACGHDGHTAMLLGAAKLLSDSRAFDGTVTFVFQPAEENHGGSMRMIADDLFKRFPVEAIYAVHNWPGLRLGAIAARVGPQMAAVDNFELSFEGLGAHAAMPQLGDDPILAAGAPSSRRFSASSAARWIRKPRLSSASRRSTAAMSATLYRARCGCRAPAAFSSRAIPLTAKS